MYKHFFPQTPAPSWSSRNNEKVRVFYFVWSRCCRWNGDFSSFRLQEQLDVALSKTCKHFDVLHYTKVQLAYTLLGKTQVSGLTCLQSGGKG